MDDDANLATLRAILTSMEIRSSHVGEHSGSSRATLCVDSERGCVDGEPIAQTVTCFCDIPFESLALHTLKYGRFGVGLDRSIVAEWSGRPVTYIPVVSRYPSARNNTFCQEVLAVWSGLHSFFPDMPTSSIRVVGASPRSPTEAVDMAEGQLAKILAFVKTFDVDLPKDHPQNYYMEREWRKFGDLPLHTPLREIVAPPEYLEALRGEFPQLCHLEFRPVKDQGEHPLLAD